MRKNRRKELVNDMNTTSRSLLCQIKRIARTIVFVLLLVAVGLLVWRLSVCIPVWCQQGPAEIRDDGVHFAGQRRVITLDSGSEMGFRWIPAGSCFVGKKAKLYEDDYNFGRRIVFPNGFWLAEKPLDGMHIPTKKGMVLSVASLEQLFYAGSLCNPEFTFKKGSEPWSPSVNAYGLMELEFDAQRWATKPDNFRLVLENDPASEFWNSPARELFEKSFNVP